MVSGAKASLKVGSFEVGVRDASLGALIKPEGTLALQVSGTPFLETGADFPSLLRFSVTQVVIAYNSTGTALNQTLTAGDLTVPLVVARGGASDPYFSVSASARLSLDGFLEVSGNFSFAREMSSATGVTKLKIGVADVTGTAGGGQYELSNGSLGLVIFMDSATSKSQGYALSGAILGRLSGGGVAAEATIRIRRNSTSAAVDEAVVVLSETVPVVFSSSEVATADSGDFSAIAVEDAVISFGGITLKGSYRSEPTGSRGESITRITEAALIFGSPELLRITADEVVYRNFRQSVSLGSVTYARGAQQVIVQGGELRLGSELSGVTIFGNFVITRASDAAPDAVTTVDFFGAGFRIQLDGRSLVEVAAQGRFVFGGAAGFRLETIKILNLNFLPQEQTAAPKYLDNQIPTPIPTKAAPSATTLDADGYDTLEEAPTVPKVIDLGPVKLAGPNFEFTNFGLNLTGDMKVRIEVGLRIGVTTASVEFGEDFSAFIMDGPDADKYGISGTFGLFAEVDPMGILEGDWVKSALTAKAGLNGFKLEVDQFRMDIAQIVTFESEQMAFDPMAFGSASESLLSVGRADVTVAVAGLRLTGGASNFAIQGNGALKVEKNFAIRMALKGGGADGLGLPDWMPVAIDSLVLQWRDLMTDPLDMVITTSVTVVGIQGIEAAKFTGSIQDLKIDVGLLRQGKFPIIGIGAMGVGIEADLFGGRLVGGLIGGIVNIGEDGQMIAADAPADTVVVDRVFFLGVQGGFSMPGVGGLYLRFALSDRGPLGLMVTAKAPAGIPIDPTGVTGLAINDFVGGVEFFATLPAITRAEDLRNRV